MKNKIWICTLIILCIELIITNSCKKDETKTNTQEVTGHVQKGPYIIGTSISMSELKPSLEQTGKLFTVQISNNSGYFDFKEVSLTSQYVEFSANGYYFDEVKGTLSIAPLNLTALSDITDISTVNVNILTHLEKLRVEFLVKHNKTFSEAKKIAQSEILAIFGFKPTEIDNSELLDISIDNEGNAMLLAISIILQGNRSVGDLSELLANISNNIHESGILNSDSIMSRLRNSTKELVLSSIRSNLQKRYQDLGIDATIPNFEKYINIFLTFTDQKPETSSLPATNISKNSVTLNGMVNANSINTNVSFEYGTTNNFGSTINATQSPLTGFSNINVDANLTGLFPGTTYHFRVKSENALGISYGNDLTFTTLGQIPSVTTQMPTNISTETATLNGLVNANSLSTIVTFEYGTSTSYGSTSTATQSPIDGASSVNVSTGLVGLSIGTTYHFRVKAENVLGVKYGNDLMFTSLGQIPTISSLTAIDIQYNSATLKGLINPNYLSTSVTFEWGTTTSYGNTISAIQNPLSGNSPVMASAKLTSLSPGVTYYYRVKAVNYLGTMESNNMTFETLSPITDVEGNTYNIVSIGSQIWMSENLKTTKYNDGTNVPLVTDNSNWSNLTTPGYCWYNNDESTYKNPYGAMYNWYTVNTNKLCPSGWHVPTDNEWHELVLLFDENAQLTTGNESWSAGGKLKEIGTTYWKSPNSGATNESGFSALPSGSRDETGIFNWITTSGYYWTSSKEELYGQLAYYRQLSNDYSGIARGNYYKSRGYSVRCIKN